MLQLIMQKKAMVGKNRLLIMSKESIYNLNNTGTYMKIVKNYLVAGFVEIKNKNLFRCTKISNKHYVKFFASFGPRATHLQG